jgi:pyridoxamine 5'-phosphate oxidase
LHEVSLMMALDQIRREYLQGGLRREDLPADPLALFETWQQQAIACGLTDPTAMVVATVSPDGQPSQRLVLLKQLDARGFVFYTNYGSRKAREIAGNPHVSLLFPWHGMERQVKVTGTAAKVSAAESVKYFMTRPRDSQLAAWASEQSAPLSSREVLMTQLARMKEKFAQGEVPLPDFWGGMRIYPNEIEFWQGGAGRLHDRFQYTRQHGDEWRIQRLAP